MGIDLLQSVTSQQTWNEQARRGAQLADGKTIRALLEKISDPDKPLVIAIYGTRKDRQPNDFFMRECRSWLIYESAAYKEFEKNRREKEEEGRKQAARQAKLNEIKAGLRKERLADDRDFDKRYDRQTEEQAEATERRIEREALTIFEAEEEQPNK